MTSRLSRALCPPVFLCPALASPPASSASILRRSLQTLRLDHSDGLGGRALADAHPKVFLRNKYYFESIKSARDALAAWGVDKMPSVTFVDAFAGNGMLTRAALELPNVTKVISMMPEPPPPIKKIPTDYEPTEVEKSFADIDDARLLAVPENAYHWYSWEGLKEHGALDHIQSRPWDEKVNNLFVAFQLGDNIHSEKMAFQIMQAAFPRLWLFTYGRFYVGFITSEAFFERATAAPGDPKRHKTAVLVETLCDLEATPSTGIACVDLRKRAQHPNPMSFRMLPKAEVACTDQLQYDALEFLTRQLFMHRSKPLQESLSFVAPNAPVILDIAAKRKRPVPGNVLPGQLTQTQWMRLVHAFLDWPFRPKDLLTPILRLGADEDDD